MGPAELERALSELRARRTVVVGDLMLDDYVWGDVARISPDAPVPVVAVRRRTRVLGGAGNVAQNLVVAGADVALVGVVGADAAGAAFRGLAREAGIAADAILEDASRPTTVKTRVIARGQHLLRLDDEDGRALDARVRATLAAAARERGAGCAVVIVSDYAKGVVDGALVAEIASGAPVVVDPKSRDFARYAGCTAITPNRQEAEEATGLALTSEDALADAARRIRERCGASLVLVTLGGDGMALGLPDGSLLTIPAESREVFDVTGAGDTVLAYFGLAIGAGLAPADAARLANLAAGIAVAKVGTSAVTPAEVLRAGGVASAAAGKALDLRQAVNRVAHERSIGRRVVFTNGCFDLLHAGHVHLLERARALGDFLVVALNSDASVRRLKGPERPVVGEADRVKILAALDAVDAVVVFDEDTPLAWIEALRPDVLVKGGDYSRSTIVGADLVLGYGGRVETVPLVGGRSTSAVVEALRRGSDG